MAKNSDTGSNLFYPDTRFERMARRPGGVERDAALERAQAAVNGIESAIKGSISVKSIQEYIKESKNLN